MASVPPQPHLQGHAATGQALPAPPMVPVCLAAQQSQGRSPPASAQLVPQLPAGAAWQQGPMPGPAGTRGHLLAARQQPLSQQRCQAAAAAAAEQQPLSQQRCQPAAAAAAEQQRPCVPAQHGPCWAGAPLVRLPHQRCSQSSPVAPRPLPARRPAGMCWPAGWQTSADSCWLPQTGPACLHRLYSTSQSQKGPWMPAAQPQGHHHEALGHPAGQVVLPAQQLTRRQAAVAAPAAPAAVSEPGRGHSLRPRRQLHSLLTVQSELSLQPACPCPSPAQQLRGQWGSHLHQHAQALSGAAGACSSAALFPPVHTMTIQGGGACSQPLQGVPFSVGTARMLGMAPTIVLADPSSAATMQANACICMAGLPPAAVLLGAGPCRQGKQSCVHA